MGLPVAVGAVTTPLYRSVSIVFDLLGKGFFGSGTHVEAMVELATPAAVEEEEGQA
jgi:hypothetical protein